MRCYSVRGGALVLKRRCCPRERLRLFWSGLAGLMVVGSQSSLRDEIASWVCSTGSRRKGWTGCLGGTWSPIAVWRCNQSHRIVVVQSLRLWLGVIAICLQVVALEARGHGGSGGVPICQVPSGNCTAADALAACSLLVPVHPGHTCQPTSAICDLGNVAHGCYVIDGHAFKYYPPGPGCVIDCSVFRTVTPWSDWSTDACGQTATRTRTCSQREDVLDLCIILARNRVRSAVMG